jgi:hypothetical protein
MGENIDDDREKGIDIVVTYALDPCMFDLIVNPSR